MLTKRSALQKAVRGTGPSVELHEYGWVREITLPSQARKPQTRNCSIKCPWAVCTEVYSDNTASLQAFMHGCWPRHFSAACRKWLINAESLRSLVNCRSGLQPPSMSAAMACALFCDGGVALHRTFCEHWHVLQAVPSPEAM